VHLIGISILSLVSAATTQVPAKPASAATPARLPNVVIFYADDLGYGDVGCFGQQRWKTPNIDRLAREGVRFTDFRVSQPVCSASRTSLLTGCYANRLGIHGALNHSARHGINAEETTLAEVCKQKGYATAAIGKWHLGHHPMFLPTRHGFDEYLGLPYSNDMWARSKVAKRGDYPPLPLFDGEKIIDSDVDERDQAELTRKYGDRAADFIDRNKGGPFFLYLAFTMPHVPLFASSSFQGRSPAGVYGDVIEELDDAVGKALAALDRNGLANDTLAIFTSDNGPWLTYGPHAGTAGPLREGKGTVYEGGLRTPFAARYPGRIPAGSVCGETAMTIDILPTIARLIGAEPPKRKIDGLDIWPLLSGQPGAKCPHEAFYHYYHQGELQAIRSGPWKLILPHKAKLIEGTPLGKDGFPGKPRDTYVKLQLYNLDLDLGERTDLVDQRPKIVTQLMTHVEAARAELGDALAGRKGSGTRPPGRLPNPGS